MRFFCTQPDIVEDVQAVRYNTHTKSKPSSAGASGGASPPRVVPRSNNGIFSTPITDTSNLNRSRTNLHNVFGAKRFFHSHSHNGESQRKLSIGAPIPITTPNINAVPIVAPASNNNANLPAVKPTSFDGRAKNFDIKPKPKSYSGENKALTDTEGLGFRRRTHRMSAPFAALKLGGGGEESGTDTGGKKVRRASKMVIGAPEEFRHEGHVGVGATFNTTPQDHGTWNVETWRAEIERTLTHNTAAPHTVSRPKGPRSSLSPDPSLRKNRGSIDGATPGVPRWSAESKRDRDGLARWSNERERDGTVSDYPIGRPMMGPHRGSVSSNASHGARQSRSRSGSQTQAPISAAPQIVGIHPNSNSNSFRGPRLVLGEGQTVLGHVQGHVPGKESITSLASTPTTVTTLSSHNTIITPTTTTTSLNRSLSDKPYYSHQHHPVQGLTRPPQTGDGNWEWTYGTTNNNNNNHLQRASSANAAVAVARYPPSSSTSSSTAASSYASHASSTTTATRRPIPTPRRKPVPQHLPATAEVSPFPTLLVVKDSSSPTNPSFPFDINPGIGRGARKRLDEEEEKRKGWRDESGKLKKEMVPLLGVPSDGAQYVTKSTKARWDGAMAEIANALRDPDAPPPPPH